MQSLSGDPVSCLNYFTRAGVATEENYLGSVLKTNLFNILYG